MFWIDRGRIKTSHFSCCLCLCSWRFPLMFVCSVQRIQSFGWIVLFLNKPSNDWFSLKCYKWEKLFGPSPGKDAFLKALLEECCLAAKPHHYTVVWRHPTLPYTWTLMGTTNIAHEWLSLIASYCYTCSCKWQQSTGQIYINFYNILHCIIAYR